MKDIWFRKALMEAAKWDEQQTEQERKMFFADARKAVIERIFTKYKEKAEKAVKKQN